MEKRKIINWRVEGMTCSNCALGVTRFLEKKGQKSVVVDFASDEVQFDYVGEEDLDSLAKGIEKLGYNVEKEVKQEDKEGSFISKLTSLEKKFYFTLFFTIPLFSHMFLPFHFLHNPLVQLILCIPVFLVGFAFFGRSALSSLRAGVPNMDVLIFIGSTAAFVYSLAGTIAFWGTPEVGNYLFYETSAMIITLVLMGNVLEQKAVKKTTTALSELAKLKVETARLVKTENGQQIEKIVSLSKVEAGDILNVLSGEAVPVDGEIIKGEANINEAMISGESVPVEKKKGDAVIGSTLCESGNFRMKATAVGEEMVLSRIIRMVKDARSEKPSVQKLADKISGIFVPLVLTIALATFLVWFFLIDVSFARSLMISIAVLVIACPCALGLATPTAVMVGVGRAAKKGILIKGGETMEVFSKIKYIVFDKTGTLTTGKFSLKAKKVLEGTEKKFDSILYAIESKSTHPLASSLMSSLEQPLKLADLTDIKEVKGKGMTAKSKDGVVLAGSFAWMREKGISVEPGHNIYLAIDKTCLGWVDLEDQIRSNVSETIEFFKSRGIEPVILSGDLKERTHSIATELGVEKYYAEKLPEEKLDVIKRLKLNGKTAMVGDGINDAPALALADVGVSLGNATEVAIQSSQIVLLSSDFSVLKHAFEVNRHTLLTIKQNLFWAFFYNAFAIPVASMGMLSPMIAALSMAFSDVIVIGNSLRLKIKKIGFSSPNKNLKAKPGKMPTDIKTKEAMGV
ncbi:MAG: cadmium-translocating P-type ATPase [Chitinophagaceae bacterium]|nr:MAG: cadmium-translocating P-type ATPase [Chitinophagaceae bacterium]